MQEITFGRYVLRELLGQGGMGQVYRAYDTATRRDVALKLLPDSAANDAEFRKRFEREAYSAAQLDEPHVVPIFDFGEIDGRLYLTMRLVDGTDLATLLTYGPLEPARAVAIIEQIASALGAAHRAGLVHRDVKPSNILLTPSDFAYLIDFGLARSGEDTTVTATGTTLGTFAYMAPERFAEGEIDARSDIYSLACVLHQCLTGERPFPGTTLASQLAGHIHTPPPNPSERLPGISPAFDDVIAYGMAKNPDDRYRSAVALAAAARGALTGTASDPRSAAPRSAAPRNDSPTITSAPFRREPAPGRSRRTGRIVVGVAAVVALVAASVGTTVLLTRDGPGPAEAATTNVVPTPGNARQSTLPFSIFAGAGIAVDAEGTVFVSDRQFHRVQHLPAGADKPTDVKFDQLSDPAGVAIDGSGTAYVTGFEVTDKVKITANSAAMDGARILKLPPGTSTPTELPTGDIITPNAIAADRDGNVYLSDVAESKIYVLRVGAAAPVALPFEGLRNASGLAVDGAGTVYVVDSGNNRVLRLDAGAPTAVELPLPDLKGPQGVAVTPAGTVYVADTLNKRIVELDSGATTPEVMPFSGLTYPAGVAVGDDGTVYVTDQDTVKKLAPE